MTVGESYTYLSVFHAVACAGSVVLTQTHPAAPYVCRTDNITLRCQYDGVGECVGCGVGHWEWGRDSQPIYHPRTHCPPSHHHLSGASGGQLYQWRLHQCEGEVPLCSSSTKWNNTEQQCVCTSDWMYVSTIRTCLGMHMSYQLVIYDRFVYYCTYTKSSYKLSSHSLMHLIHNSSINCLNA